MTEQEKQQLVEAVITQLKREGTDVSQATVVSDAGGVAYVLCYDNNNNIVRVTPSTFDGVSEITWERSNHIDDYIEAGVYDIAGTRWRNDGLPITNVGENATIAARLIVTVTPEGASTYRHSIGQTLILSNAEGKETKMYTRNGNRTSADGGVTYTVTWEPWATLQTNINVDAVDNLDDLKDNGIYSGVWTKGSYNAYPLTFVCIVINDYFVGTAPRRISQFVYGLSKFDGSTVYLSRVWDDSKNVWGDWEILNQKEISSMISNEIKKVTDGVDPEKLDSLKDLITWVDTHGGEVAGIKNDIQANEAAIEMETERAMEAEEKLEEKIANEKTALVNGDTIVGQAREVYSRQGKVDSATFLKRTTAGGTSVSDGVASVKQIGGNIVKNIIGDIQNVQRGISVTDLGHGLYKAEGNGVALTQTTAAVIFNTSDCVAGHKYYMYNMLCSNASNVNSYLCGVADANDFTLSYIPLQNNYQFVSAVVMINKIYLPKMFHYYPLGYRQSTAGNEVAVFSKPAVIDLTEMFGAGNEPTKEECDRMFACMGALPQGLTIAQPTGLKSTGYNQWNPKNVLINKTITDNAIVDGDRNIAVIECLPCKTGTGENNGYIIGYGEGDSWSVEGIEVYFSPLNPMDYIGQDVDLYMHKLETDSDYSSYVPQCNGYLLIVTPTIDKLCVHFHWSGDRATTDYEPYVESSVAMPVIPEMSEWGLAGIQTSGTMAQDTIDLENKIFHKRIKSIDLGELNWSYATEVWNVYSYDDKRLYIPKRMAEGGTTVYAFPSLDYYTENRIKSAQYNKSDNSISITSNEGVYVAGEVYNFSQEVVIYKATCTQVLSYAPSGDKKSGNILCSEYPTISRGQCYYGTEIKGIGLWGSGYLSVVDNKLSGKSTSEIKEYLSGVKLYYEQTETEEYSIVTKAAPNYIGSDYGVEEFTGSKVPLVANILFYMRSLVSETRNFLDRLMARLGISDATAVADKIADAIIPQDTTTEDTEEEPTKVIEEV